MAGPPPVISKEQKQLDVSIDVTIQRLTDVKTALQTFLFKLENEPLGWPDFLDSFALVSSHLTILNKTLKSEKASPFRSHGLLPLFLFQELDTELQRVTEGRVPTFNHEVVPNHLRTRPEPDVEIKENNLTQRVINTNLETGQKQINSFKRFVENILDTITNYSATMDGHTDRERIPPSYSVNDTRTLMEAVTQGKGFKPIRGPGTDMPTSSSPTPMMSTPGGTAMTNKMTSSVKTNIKAAVTHSPYMRN